MLTIVVTPLQFIAWWLCGVVMVYIPLLALADVAMGKSYWFKQTFSGNNRWLLIILNLTISMLWPLMIPAFGLVIALFGILYALTSPSKK